MNSILMTMELEVQDNQLVDGDIEDWMLVAVNDHFEDEMKWMSREPLVQMIRLLRECPMIDGIEFFVDTKHECKVLWNRNMNGGEYELFSRYPDDPMEEEWTMYESFAPDNIGTLADVIDKVQNNLNNDIQYRKEWMNLFNELYDNFDYIDDDKFANFMYGQIAKYKLGHSDVLYGTTVSDGAIEWATNNMMQHIVDLYGNK